MSVTPSPIGGFAAQFFDNNGVILSGGKIYTYAAGTTTPQATYTSAAGVTPHANPIILDSAGRVPGGEIWLTDGLVYKFVIETATSILIGTYDNITGVNSNFVNYTVQEEVITATAGQTVFNLATINYEPGTNSLTVYIDGVNQYVGDSYLETDSNTVTFTSGVHVGGEVKFTTAVQTTTGAVDASIVSYEPPFTGSVATNVEAKLAQYVSVKDFGAVGDGVTDDTVAIQAALTYAGNLNGAEVFFPSGSYNSGKLTVPSNVTLRGQTSLQGGATRLNATGSQVFATPAGAGFHFFNIYNLAIWGDRVDTDFIDQSGGGNWAFSTVANCYIVNIRNFHTLTTGNHFFNNNFQNIVSMQLRGGDYTVINNYIGYDDTDATRGAGDGFVEIISSAGVDFSGNYITSMKATGAPIPLVVSTSSQDVRVLNNWIDGGESYGLAIASGSFRISANFNRFGIIYPATCIPVLLSNVTDVNVNENQFNNLAASAPFITFASTLERCSVLNNLTNSRTDATTHDYGTASVSSGVRMVGNNLAVKNTTTDTDIYPPLFGRTIINQGTTGLTFFYVTTAMFLPGDYFNFSRTNTGQRLIIRNTTTSTNIYDSNVDVYNTGRVICYVAGTLTVEQTV